MHLRFNNCLSVLKATQSSFNIINQSTPLQRHSVNELHIMLKYALHRLKSHPQVRLKILIRKLNL